MANKFDSVRTQLMNDCRVLFEGLQYDVLRTGSQELCLPVVGDDNEEGYIVVTFKVPKGSRDGEAYDGYAMAEDYKMKVEAKTAKKAEADRKKAEKMKRDAEIRKQKAEIRKAKKEKESE